MHRSDIDTRSPDVSSMSSSRGGWTSLASAASRKRSSVVFPMALTTTTTSSPCRFVRATWSATARTRSVSPTDVPPNFCTTSPTRADATCPARCAWTWARPVLNPPGHSGMVSDRAQAGKTRSAEGCPRRPPRRAPAPAAAPAQRSAGGDHRFHRDHRGRDLRFDRRVQHQQFVVATKIVDDELDRHHDGRLGPSVSGRRRGGCGGVPFQPDDATDQAQVLESSPTHHRHLEDLQGDGEDRCRDLRDHPQREGVSDSCQQLRLPRPQQVLQLRDLPPCDPRFRRPGRGPDGDRDREGPATSSPSRARRWRRKARRSTRSARSRWRTRTPLRQPTPTRTEASSSW